ncbi:uncharacterized protein LOC120012428 [Tripterygium wilfordii]|uniref:uncharacterized protein LOC120012428 n=1 Tax=Tripterygium wilfordii TaxID=458696 RepID=UPI0018F7F567|nr:uncharacterized protein LOC120012428 [Tripterygium wilfordii]
MAMLLLFSLLFAANATIVARVGNIQAVGFLVCSRTGLITSGSANPGLVGVGVNLTCDGGRTTLATAITSNTGFFNLSASNIPLVNRPSLPSTNCVVQAQLPIRTCNLLPATGGILIGVLDLVTQTLDRIALLLGDVGVLIL